jgi:EAL domain-containing protein (putative c-di-GMP-specific phosphodiesterase class I)
LREEDMCQAMLYTLNSFSESSGGNVNFGSLSEGCKAMLSETVGWQQRIKRTIAGDAFTLVYQPIVDLSDGQAHHYEVLTRLNDDPKASPYKFITMAEQLGKIAEFDWAVMERAFKVLRKAGPERAVSIAVNISGRSLAAPEYVRSVTSAIKMNSDLAKFILFEVTESSKIIDLQSANKTLKTFRGLGVSVCLDDFGVGATAFEYLRCLQVDFVKIDGRFVRDAAHSKFSRAFIKSISALCKELGIETIAEFVEDDAATKLLRSFGVNHGQGYHFGKPIPQLPWEQEDDKAAAAPSHRQGWDPTVGRRAKAG